MILKLYSLCLICDMTDYSQQFLSTLSVPDNTVESIFVFPGQDISNSITDAKRTLSVGDGLCQNGPTIRGTISGKLRHREPNSFWVSHTSYIYSMKGRLSSLISFLNKTQ